MVLIRAFPIQFWNGARKAEDRRIVDRGSYRNGRHILSVYGAITLFWALTGCIWHVA
jgi:hypothetical protein